MHLAANPVLFCHVFVFIQVDFPGSGREALQAFVLRIRQNTFDVSHLFASDPSIVEQYGPSPFITELDLSYRVCPCA